MSHEAFMQRAIDLANSVLSATPNPRVGCVIVRDGQVVGEGLHRRAGEAHAEINALQAAGELAQDSTVYVTLEPCAHTGRTGPCAEALIAAGVARVVYGMVDPDPRVSGEGLQKLRAAGIEVYGPVLESAAADLNRGFIRRISHGLPWVRCKMAMSLDGRTAMASGESKWITGPGARADVQRMRASSCAILTGSGTVAHDNPALNVRPAELPLKTSEVPYYVERQPLRVVVDSGLRTPATAQILKSLGTVVLATGRLAAGQQTRFIADAGPAVHVRECPQASANGVDLRCVLELLASDYHCNEVMIEAGPTLSGAMLAAGLVDELVVFIGGCVMGSDAMPLFELPGIQYMKDKVTLKFTDIREIDGDCRITARIV